MSPSRKYAQLRGDTHPLSLYILVLSKSRTDIICAYQKLTPNILFWLLHLDLWYWYFICFRRLEQSNQGEPRHLIRSDRNSLGLGNLLEITNKLRNAELASNVCLIKFNWKSLQKLNRYFWSHDVPLNNLESSHYLCLSVLLLTLAS